MDNNLFVLEVILLSLIALGTVNTLTHTSNLLLKQTKIHLVVGQGSGFKTLESGDQCFYISTVKKLPFGSENTDELSKECAKMKLEPARIKSTDDFQAIAEAAGIVFY